MTELTLKVTDEVGQNITYFKNNPSIFQAPNRHHKHPIIRTLVGIIADTRQHHQERRLFHFVRVEFACQFKQS